MRVVTSSDQLFFCTTRIQATDARGANSVGTGFFFLHKVDSEREALLLVTNRHVIQNQVYGTIAITQSVDGQPALGRGIDLTIPQDYWRNWCPHPDPSIDVAILPIGEVILDVSKRAGMELFFRAIDSSMIPTDEQIANLDSLESVTFVGYPNGIWDEVNKLPIVRKGTTATPLAVDYENSPRFLIDASVFGGSSGSPVFIHDNGHYSSNGSIVVGHRFYLLGLVAAVYQRTSHNRIISVPIPTQHIPVAEQNEMLDLGVVFKARTIMETIEYAIKIELDRIAANSAPASQGPLPNLRA